MSTEPLTAEERQRRLVEMDLERFVKILAIELEHLCDHIKLIVDDCRDRKQQRTITERVCDENVAVLANEETACHRFARDILKVDPKAYGDLPELEEAIRKRMHRLASKAGFAPAALCFADKKISKVARYVSETV